MTTEACTHPKIDINPRTHVAKCINCQALIPNGVCPSCNVALDDHTGWPRTCPARKAG